MGWSAPDGNVGVMAGGSGRAAARLFYGVTPAVGGCHEPGDTRTPIPDGNAESSERRAPTGRNRVPNRPGPPARQPVPAPAARHAARPNRPAPRRGAALGKVVPAAGRRPGVL